jgi:hypothetical protein
MAQKPLAVISQTLRGIGASIRAEPKVIWGATVAVSAFNLVVPVLVLSIFRKRPDYFTFNPWLSRLPEYLLSEAPLSRKLSFLSNMAIGWVSANGIDGVEWGFIVDVPTLVRILVTSLVFGTYFALWSYRRHQGEACGVPSKVARPAGMAGALTSVFGLTTGPCTLAGCGVPVLPVIGLAFTGVSSGTLNFFRVFSQVSIVVVLAAMSVAVAWFGWRAGTTRVGGVLQSS